MAIKLLWLAVPSATETSHWTIKVVVDPIVVVTACNDAGICASAGSVFIAI